MTCRLLVLVFSVSVGIVALAQPHPDEKVRSIRNAGLQLSYPIDVSIPRLIRDPENREYKIRRHNENFYFTHTSEIDTGRPNYMYYTCSYSTSDGDSAKVYLYINPENDAISFDVTNGFEELSIDGVNHCVRGNQRFTQTTLRNSYEGPFTAMFLGAFTMPYSERYPQRAGGCWGPSEFITTSTYTAYDVSRSYLDVQSICILIEGDPRIADLIMSKIRFEALNEAIEKL